MFDINQVITNHINSIDEPGVRAWLTKLHEAKAFYFSVDAVAYYQYQQQDWGCLSYGEMQHILGVLGAIEARIAADCEAELRRKRSWFIQSCQSTNTVPREPVIITRINEDEFPSISVGGLAVDTGLYHSNGGVACDNLNGPCSCGAWHKGDAND